MQVREKQVEKLLPGVHFCRLATGAMALWCAVGALGAHCILSEKAARCMDVLCENSLIVASAKERKIWRILSAAD